MATKANWASTMLRCVPTTATADWSRAMQSSLTMHRTMDPLAPRIATATPIEGCESQHLPRSPIQWFRSTTTACSPLRSTGPWCVAKPSTGRRLGSERDLPVPRVEWADSRLLDWFVDRPESGWQRCTVRSQTNYAGTMVTAAPGAGGAGSVGPSPFGVAASRASLGAG